MSDGITEGYRAREDFVREALSKWGNLSKEALQLQAEAAHEELREAAQALGDARAKYEAARLKRDQLLAVSLRRLRADQ